jgi:uncharacterized protein YqgC (DUF456 family)
VDYAIFTLCLLAMLLGLAGTILPIVPGLVLVFLAYLGYGFYDHWTHYGLTAMLIVGGLTLLSIALDQVASVIGAQKLGAGKAGMVGSFVCAIIGLVFFSLPGLIVGAFGGAVIFEIIFNHKELEPALKAGGGALLGLLMGAFFKFLIALILTLYFVWLVFFN